jgi:hypothetical protein
MASILTLDCEWEVKELEGSRKLRVSTHFSFTPLWLAPQSAVLGTDSEIEK